ncbi:MAG: hypothetical protein H0A75_09190 [Candidatus Methanofishera endochildressiae]|uniref:Phage head morphogenesis domain-containing protein n=1 Tax=Candidatus Methanofishera endochildressiae TaxID=2738884 RepID=A0A7Z0MQ54_9GAMM|nr:hypothetical protein [Candidatus Methanofishera endochildressiae]
MNLFISRKARQLENTVIVKMTKDSDIKGWISVAILDNRTSAICIGFTNKYYSIKDYPTRESIPNKPPRHPRCRSTIVAVRKGDRIAPSTVDTVDNFLFRMVKLLLTC